MPPSRQASESTENNVSLNDILNTPALRTELAAVIALCTDALRRDLLSTFESKQQVPNVAQGNSNYESLIDFQDPEDAAQEELREARRRDEADIQSARTQGLRRAAVTYFDKWQIDVLRRLGEVLSVRPDAVRKARADARARAEAAAKAKRDQAYWDWANGMDGKAGETGDSEAATETNILPDGFRARVLELPKDKRILVLDSVLLLLLSLEHYSAHSRVLMLNLTQVFQLPESMLVEHESKVAEGLLASAAAKMAADESTKRQASEDATARRWKVGLATVAGAALIGVTGGLAAPILAASLGGIMGGVGLGAVASLLGPLATNMVLVGGLFGAYGGRMTGGIMEKYAQEIKDFQFLPVSSGDLDIANLKLEFSGEETGLGQLQDPEKRRTRKLRVVIGISGSVTDARDFVDPWTVFSESRIEAFGLRWEMDALKQLGRKISELVRSFAWDFAKYQLLSMVLAGLWPFGLLRAGSTLDSPFAIAKTRSDKAGKVLADALINKVQGARPVTLVGYGLGARVIYSCLIQLAEQNAFGLVESVVLMGAPTPSDAASWRRLRAVVGGRVVNVFSADDFVLGLMYRASSLQGGIAGVQKVEGVAGVENYDFTDMVKGHDKYRHLVGTILQRVGFADLDSGIIRQQQELLKQDERRSKMEREASGSRNQQPEDSALAKEDGEGHIVLVDDGKFDPNSKSKSESKDVRKAHTSVGRSERVGGLQELEEDEDESNHIIRMEDNEEPMAMLEPGPEPDYGPDRETVSFGAGGQGFNVEWDYSRR